VSLSTSSSNPSRSAGPNPKPAFFLSLFVVGALASLLIMTALCEHVLRSQVVPNDHFWHHVDLFYDTLPPSAAFGDSHIARGFIGHKNSPNLAYPSEALPQMETKIRALYEDRQIVPQKIIFQVSPQMFAKYREEDFQRNYVEIFERGQKRYTPFGLYIFDGYYRKRLIAYLKSYALRGRLEQQTEFMEYGGILSDDVLRRTKNTAEKVMLKNRILLHIPEPGFEHSEYAAILERSIAFLKEKGADVCMVSMPASTEYRQMVSDLGYGPNFQNAFTYFQNVQKKHKARYVSFYTELDDDTLFMNPDHLNRDGAKHLTPIIFDRCFAN